MNVFKTKKSHCYKLYQRKSVLTHFKSESYEKKYQRRLRMRHLIKNLRQTYKSICLFTSVIFRVFVFIDQLINGIFTFVQQIVQIIRVVHGWIQMIRVIFSSLYLIVNRLMLLSSHIHRLSSLFSIILQPLSNRTFEQSIRTFSYAFFYYYSSNGACYTLKARTQHIAGIVKERWTKKYYCIDNDDDDDDIYYDTFEDEPDWF